MTWITAAIVSAVLLAVANVVDSHLIKKRMPSLWSFLVLAGPLHVLFGIIFLQFYPLADGVGAFPWFIALGSSVLRSVAVLLMLYDMRTEEVSRIIPVVNTQPIFVAILAAPLLGEALSGQQWLAIVLMVAGAILISMKWDGEKRGARLRRSFVMLVTSSLLFGVANVGTKYGMDYFSSWNMYCIGSFCFGSMFFLIALWARPQVFRDLRDMEHRGNILTVVGINETVALAGIILSFWAMERGPISLVTAIQGSRPLFVFLIALILSVFIPAALDEHWSRGVVALKVVSIALIVGGVMIINLVGA